MSELNKVYTLVAYKPESDDYCKGCHMEHYYAQFDMAISENEEDIIKKWSSCLVTNKELRPNEEPWEMNLLINGRSASHSPGNIEPDSDEEDEWIKNFNEEVSRISYKAKEAADQAYTKLVEDRKKAIEEEKIQQQEEEMQQKRKQFERLKAELGET